MTKIDEYASKKKEKDRSRGFRDGAEAAKTGVAAVYARSNAYMEGFRAGIRSVGGTGAR